MDNGLIFPYRRRTAHMKSGVLSIPRRVDPFGDDREAACDPIWWSERINRCDAGR